MGRSEVRENDHEGKLLYWELEESFLDKLIAWRRDVKKRPAVSSSWRKLRKSDFADTEPRGNGTFGKRAEFPTQNSL